jgi:hypothetical protein
MKAISEIVSVVMIIAVSIGLISAAYLYSLPLLEKSQDRSELERIISFFNYYNPSSLPQKIEFVANTGSTETLKLDARGIWEIHPFNEVSPLNNSIVFSFISKVTNINTRNLISLTEGETCPPRSGVVGKESYSTVCIKGSPAIDGFNITYFIFFRNITSPSGEIYSINIISSTGTTVKSTGNTIRISKLGMEKNQNIIITKVKIEIS